MSEFSMDYQAVLRLPLRTFWGLNRQVDRLRAEREQRLLRLHSAVEDPKSAERLAQDLMNQIGSPVLYERKFDAKKFDELRKRFSRQGRVVSDTHTE